MVLVGKSTPSLDVVIKDLAYITIDTTSSLIVNYSASMNTMLVIIRTDEPHADLERLDALRLCADYVPTVMVGEVKPHMSFNIQAARLAKRSMDDNIWLPRRHYTPGDYLSMVNKGFKGPMAKKYMSLDDSHIVSDSVHRDRYAPLFGRSMANKKLGNWHHTGYGIDNMDNVSDILHMNSMISVDSKVGGLAYGNYGGYAGYGGKSVNPKLVGRMPMPMPMFMRMPDSMCGKLRIPYPFISMQKCKL